MIHNNKQQQQQQDILKQIEIDLYHFLKKQILNSFLLSKQFNTMILVKKHRIITPAGILKSSLYRKSLEQKQIDYKKLYQQQILSHDHDDEIKFSNVNVLKSTNSLFINSSPHTISNFSYPFTSSKVSNEFGEVNHSQPLDHLLHLQQKQADDDDDDDDIKNISSKDISLTDISTDISIKSTFKKKLIFLIN